MTAYSLPKVVFQISEVASVLAGILLIFGFVLHPAGEDPTFGTDPLWVPAHGLYRLYFLALKVQIVYGNRGASVFLSNWQVLLVFARAVEAHRKLSAPSS